MSNCYGISISEVRKILHQYPETSGDEKETAARIQTYLQKIEGLSIHDQVGGNGIVAIKKYGPGPALGFRAELDGLPIAEKSEVQHTSKVDGKSHACGHDGHMAMVLELLCMLENSKTKSGTVVLFFQPSEETGEGAAAMVKHIHDHDIAIPSMEICFAIHNIPGRPLGTVLMCEGAFACASVGVQLKLFGKTAHAAHPEDAVNPLLIACALMQFGLDLPKSEDHSGFTLCTAISLESGSKTFGTSPDEALLRLTLRADSSEVLNIMCKAFETECMRKAEAAGAVAEVEFFEHFRATENTRHGQAARQAAENAGLSVEDLDKAFRWSEDFAHFDKLCPIFLIGLGSGIDQPALHAPNFDFPNELIPMGAALYHELYKAIQG